MDVMGEPVTLTGAGRTDSGCHARGQVASFTTRATLPARAVVPELRRRLPADLLVASAADVASDFDARRSALARRYVYRLLDRDDVLERRFAWHPRVAIDAYGLARAVQPLEGEHDCTSFQASGGSPTCPRCRIDRARWDRWEGGWRFEVVANHFLYHMVRNIVGTALQLAGRPDPDREMTAILAARDRARAGPTAPPQGLCLEEVIYPEASL